MIDRALFAHVPEASFDWVELGDFPTPVSRVELPQRGELFIKRDDLSSEIYGGNKVRTLETLFGAAKARGDERIYATGAFGSNHAAATVLHAPRAGLDPGVILFPQPSSLTALESARVILSVHPRVHALPHWSFLPFGMAWAQRLDRRDGVRSTLMVPGGATPQGAIGYVSAALELAEQVERGELPAPKRVVTGVGSTCTSAGLLVGMRLAAELGIGWTRAPKLISVRVTPWPVTAAFRIVGLAARTASLLADHTGRPGLRYSKNELAAGLELDGRELGRGYGHPTDAGRDAIERFREHAGFELDTTYSAKAAASAIARLEDGPTVFWSTKSTAPLPEVSEADWRWAPDRIVRWIERAQGAHVHAS